MSIYCLGSRLLLYEVPTKKLSRRKAANEYSLKLKDLLRRDGWKKLKIFPKIVIFLPICSMYAIYIYHGFQPNVGIYSIHGALE